MISKKMQDAINKQVTAEFYSAHLYLSMAAYLESIDLPGFANWMRIQYQEEVSHAMK
ncbi:MAG: ferritin, partial [Deltaproteobacteria bacterium]|nr:ferritin [Deltaproteobacteria bacterium]